MIILHSKHKYSMYYYKAIFQKYLAKSIYISNSAIQIFTDLSTLIFSLKFCHALKLRW
uniref:Uncharacterized protein n=1 Tax=Anguilla anguilla TaxID=7936 RepID=A0A0E9X7H1_ANGAN